MINNIGVLPIFKGISVHDFWNPYLSYSCTHSFCCAHILRELKRVEEETDQKWPPILSELLVQAKYLKEMFHLDEIPIPTLMVNSIKSSYDELIQSGLAENPPPIHIAGKRGRKKKRFTRNLLERLVIHKDGVLRFIDHIRVPFENNLTERDIRMMKVKRKFPEGSGTNLPLKR